MKTTIEIVGPLFKEANALAAKQGLRSKTEPKPFRLRDGSFRGGHGLQSGLKWGELTALAYADEGGSA